MGIVVEHVGVTVKGHPGGIGFRVLDRRLAVDRLLVPTRTVLQPTNYTAAYQRMIKATHTPEAPWHIVPADRKWYRNAVIARIVRMTLEAMDLSYPAEMPGLDSMRIE